MTRTAVLLTLAAFVLAGCGGGTAHRNARQRAPRFATAQERRFLERLGRWDQRVVEPFRSSLYAYTAAYGNAPLGPLLAAARTIVTCEASLDRDVGAPPTRRLATVRALMRSACRPYAALGRSVRKRRRTTIVFGALANDAAHELASADRTHAHAIRRSLLGWQPRLPPRAGGSHANRRLGAVVTGIAGRPVEVHCWSTADWRALNGEFAALDPGSRDVELEGWTYVDGGSIELAPPVCGHLERLLRSGRPRTFDDSESVKVLAHEAEHAAGVADEAVAECYALQLVPETARSLGLTTAQGRVLAHEQWRHYPDELPGYRTGLCVQGGTFDLKRPLSVWSEASR